MQGQDCPIRKFIMHHMEILPSVIPLNQSSAHTVCITASDFAPSFLSQSPDDKPSENFSIPGSDPNIFAKCHCFYNSVLYFALSMPHWPESPFSYILSHSNIFLCQHKRKWHQHNCNFPIHYHITQISMTLNRAQWHKKNPQSYAKEVFYILTERSWPNVNGVRARISLVQYLCSVNSNLMHGLKCSHTTPDQTEKRNNTQSRQIFSFMG